MDRNKMDLPSLDKLKELEKSSRVDGSGIEFDSLLDYGNLIQFGSRDQIQKTRFQALCYRFFQPV